MFQGDKVKRGHGVIVERSKVYLRSGVFASEEWWTVSGGDWLVPSTLYFEHNMDQLGLLNNKKGGFEMKNVTEQLLFLKCFPTGGVQEGLGELQRSQH